MDAFALEPIPHSRSTLAAVVVAHVAAALLIVQIFEARRYIDPQPLVVELLPAPKEQIEKVDVAPQPLPQAPEPVQEVRKAPEPVKKPEPILREEPRPIERVVQPEPVPAPPPVEAAPPEPVPVPPPPQPVVAAPEPTAITLPAAPAPVVAPPPPVPAEPEEVTLSHATLAAMYLRNPKPGYPGASRRLGEQGTVYLRVFVTAAGNPDRVELKASSGFPRLDQSARDAVARWKFTPARRGNQDVDAWVVVPIKFSIKG
ncbi:MAG TPA: TonB family protein [Burkholderiales bacterium]|nr:TonB family protein [Burkholderiales bacterium]